MESPFPISEKLQCKSGNNGFSKKCFRHFIKQLMGKEKEKEKKKAYNETPDA